MADANISKMTEMLLAGGKMLGVHCATCRGPLFEYQKKIVCPVCSGKAKPAEGVSKSTSFKKLEEVLQVKIDSLTDQLAKETDHAKTLEILESIKSALQALEKLKGGL